MRNPNSFWDRVAESYAKKPVSNQAAYEEKLRITRSHFRPDMKLLEFGCGTGTTALLHAPHVKHIRATDVSAKMIEIARGKAEDQGIANVTFEQTSVEDLVVADESLDMVLAMSILHLLKDMDAMLAKVHRMLKPGGLLVSSTVCLGDSLLWNAVIRVIGPIGRLLGRMPLVRVFSEKHLVERLTAAGFVVEHQWRPEKSLGVFIVARKAGQGPHPESSISGLAPRFPQSLDWETFHVCTSIRVRAGICPVVRFARRGAGGPFA